MLSDNGPAYRSQSWRSMLAKNKIRPIFISKYRPQSNQTERQMRELGRFLRTYANKDHRSWDTYLKQFEEITNNLVHDSTGYAPVLIQRGKMPSNPLKDLVPRPPNLTRINWRRVRQKVKENLNRNAQKRNRMHNQKYQQISYQVGDKVLLKNMKQTLKGNQECQKLYKRYIGPFVIKEVRHANAYQLASVKTGRNMGLRHVSDLKPFYE